jgi:DUF1365 family protein
MGMSSSMATEPAGYLYVSRITHMRRHPLRYRFLYRAFYLLLDIDRFAQAARGMRWFSYNRFNLFSFHDRDHGTHDGRPLRPWLEDLLGKRGIRLAGGRIRLLAMPRILGYVFNPISVFFCEHADGTLRAILCEVRNTFGEQHCYLLSREGQPMDYAEPLRKAKVFHVSPLIDMGGEYRFRFTPMAERFHIQIRLFQPHEGRERFLMAAGLQGERRPLTDQQLLVQFLKMPLMTLKVVAAIHWQALRIWRRGTPFVRKPAPPAQGVS